MGMSPADNSIKIWQNLPINNPKPVVKIHWIFLKLSSENENMGVSRVLCKKLTKLAH